MADRKKKLRDSSNTQETVLFGKDLPFAASEAYRLMRTSLIFSLPGNERKCKVIGITSANAGEGKSTTALNLAYMLAEAHNQTLLIEADMRLPTISKRLGLNRSPGLSNVLVGIGGKDAVQPSGIEERLRVIAAGDIPPNPSELLGSVNMKKLIEALSTTVNFIVLDLPPINEVSDALVVSQYTDGVVMVVRQNYASRRAVGDAMRQLEHVNAKVLGFVMTASTTGIKGPYKKYKYKKYGKPRPGYGYGYGYAYARRPEQDESTDKK